MAKPKMTTETLVEVKAIFEECTGFEWDAVKLTDDLRLDVWMDELEFEDFSIELELRLDMELPEGWYSEVKTMGELVEYLDQHLAA